MKIPTGYWMVVQRRIGNYSQGDIVKSGLSEEQAKYYAEFLKDKLSPNYNVWAIHKDNY